MCAYRTCARTAQDPRRLHVRAVLGKAVHRLGTQVDRASVNGETRVTTEFIECPMCRQQVECDLEDTADDPISRMTGDAMPRALKNHFDEHMRNGRDIRMREISPDMLASAEAFFGAQGDEVQAMFAGSDWLIGKPAEADIADLSDDDLAALVWNDVSTSAEPQRAERAADRKSVV